jgi:exonuclease SbcC
MQLLRLRLLNFRQHEHTDLVLGPGLLAVVGPNGSGKTTLLEAIAWALYGTAAARGTRDSIKRRGAPPRSRVEVLLEFVLGLHTYGLTRTLTAAELSQDGHVIANSTGAVTERITSLLGMSREEFFNTYFTGQKDLAVMAAMTPADRARFLSRVLGYEKLREAQERLRERRSGRRAELAGLEQGLVDADELAGALAQASEALDGARQRHAAAATNTDTALQALRQLEPDWAAATARRTAWQGLDGERRVIEGRVLAARAAFDALDRDLAGALDARNKLAPLAVRLEEWPALVAAREALDQAAVEVTARSRAVARREAAQARLEAIGVEVAELANDEAVASLAETRQAALTAREQFDLRVGERRTRWKQDEQEAKTKLDVYRDRYKELREQRTAIEEAGPEGICPFCTRPLGDDFPRTVALLAAQMEEVEASGGYFRQRVDQLRQSPDDLTALETQRAELEAAFRQATEALVTAEGQRDRRRRLLDERDRLEAELAALEAELKGTVADYDPERHREVRERLTELEPLRREHDQLVGLANRAEALVAEAAAAEQRASEAEALMADLDRRIAALAWDGDAFAALQGRMEAAQLVVQQAEVALARSSTEVEGATRLRESVVARQADRAAKAEAAKRLAADIERWNELDRALGDLRGELNQQLRPDLRERASLFLQHLTRGRYDDLDLTEDYVPIIVEDGETKPVISGGEEDVVNLALRLAISQMIADRAGQPLSLLVLDEVFGSLDEERRQAVVDLLRAVADRFPQVILISHVEALRDAFDRVVRVTFDEERGITTVRDDVPEPVGVEA